LKKSTNYYIRLHSAFLAGLDDHKRQNEISTAATIYDHMYEFFRKLDLTHDQAMSIIDDFRTHSLIEDVRFQTSR